MTFFITIPRQGLLTIILTIALYSYCFGQQPIITSINKTSAGTAEIITIAGNNFGTIQGDLVVFFGAAQGELKFTSNQLLEVEVPAGATFGRISVTHLVSGLTGYSKENFFPSFGGTSSFTASNLEGQKDFQTIPDTDMKGLYDLCTCDFNRDGINDIATANQNSNSMSLLKNITSAAGIANVNFEVSSILVNTKTLHLTCGDLNGDGKPDLVATEGGDTGDRVIILKNTSSGSAISFQLPATFVKITGKKVKRIKISDLNGDGKPELIVTGQNTNNITILKNESSTGLISFSTSHIFIPVAGAATTDALAVDDIDGDGLEDIVVSQFNSATSNVFILRNTGGSGSISFAPALLLPLSGVVADLYIADLNNDEKQDLIPSMFIDSSSGRLDVLLNSTTSPGTITYNSPTTIATGGNPFGIGLGDLNGDKKLDIVLSSITKKELKILQNTGTGSTISFNTIVKPATFINRHITVSDYDGDSKPDISFASVDDLASGIPASKVSIFRNTSCVQPELLPEGPLTICESFPLELTSTVIPGATYTWKNGTTVVSSGTDPFYNVSTTPGIYNYTVTVSDCASPIPSTPVQVTVQSGTLPVTPIASSNGPVCEGSLMQLSVNTGDTFEWTGPGTLPNPTDKEPAISNFQAEDAGRYTVDIYLNGCLAARESTLVEVIAVPDFTISTGGSSVVCNGDTKTLTLSPALTTFTYQWYNDAGPMAGETSTTYEATVSGNYYVEAASAQCSAAIETSPVMITFAPPIIADFTFLDDRCVGQDIEFTNLSTFDSSLPVTYAWNFGDAGTADVKNAVHRYQTASTFTITLQMSYENGACLDDNIKVLVVHAAPVVSITAPNNDFSLCEGESIELGVSGIFNSYNWNTGESTATITASEERSYIVNVTNDFGCEVTASKNVTVTPAPEVIISATPPSVLEGESSQLEASGLENYTWDPDPTLSALNIPNPIATPLQTTLYKVQGVDGNGCAGEGFIEVILKSGSPSSKVLPSNFFSPGNGDEINKFWTVERIEEFPECGILIYDDKGVQVFQAKPYLNDWDGTFNGKALPDGVYYFIIKCEGDTNPPRTGSITILR